jgi:hypothetical protein
MILANDTAEQHAASSYEFFLSKIAAKPKKNTNIPAYINNTWLVVTSGSSIFHPPYPNCLIKKMYPDTYCF